MDHEPGYDGDFVAVARLDNPLEAPLLCHFLVSCGVPAMLADADTVRAYNLWALAVGGIRLLVPASRVAEARELLAAFRAGEVTVEGDLDAQALAAGEALARR